MGRMGYLNNFYRKHFFQMLLYYNLFYFFLLFERLYLNKVSLFFHLFIYLTKRFLETYFETTFFNLFGFFSGID